MCVNESERESEGEGGRGGERACLGVRRGVRPKGEVHAVERVVARPGRATAQHLHIYIHYDLYHITDGAGHRLCVSLGVWDGECI
jgi:hypothetical protein